MPRRTKAERERIVIDAAIERLRQARLNWSAAITFGDLAEATGIDQAQIARDFGSKDQLMERVVAAILDPETIEAHLEHAEENLGRVIETLETDEAPPQPFTLADWALDYGDTSDAMVDDDGELDLLKSQLLLWATASPGSAEWRGMRNVVETLAARTGKDIEDSTQFLVDTGMVVRRDLFTSAEFTMVVGAIIEGLMIRRSVAPHLVSDGLTGRAVAALLLGLAGPDDESPLETLRKIQIG